MSDLLQKARRLVKETGCNLKEAAAALRDASEDYDLAHALLTEDQIKEEPQENEILPAFVEQEENEETSESIPLEEKTDEPILNEESSTNDSAECASEETEKPVGEPVKTINEKTEKDRIDNIQFIIPAKKPTAIANYIMAVFFFVSAVIFLVAGFSVATTVYDLDEVLEKAFEDPMWLITGGLGMFVICAIVMVIIAIIFLCTTKTSPKESKYIRQLKELKAQFPMIADKVIFNAFKACFHNKQKAAVLLAKISDPKSGLRKDGTVDPKIFQSLIPTLIFAAIFIAGWNVAVWTYTPGEEFDTTQIAGVLTAFVALIIAVIMAAKSGKNGKRAAAGSWLSLAELFVIGIAAPVADWKIYSAFLEKLLTYIVAGIVLIIILGALFGRSSNKQSSPKPKKTIIQEESRSPLANVMSYDEYGHKVGEINSDGRMYNSNGSYVGSIESDGRMYDEYGHFAGSIEKDGRIYDEHGHFSGNIDSDGRIYDEYGHYKGSSN